MNIKNVYIGNEESWAINGIKRGIAPFFPTYDSFIVSVPREPISNGWSASLENLLYRIEKVSDFIKNEESIGLATQAGLLFLPGLPYPVMGVVSGITLGKNDITIGISLGVDFAILSKNELFTSQLASVMVKSAALGKSLDDLLLHLTRGYISLAELVESSVKNAYVSLKMKNFMPKTLIPYLKENLFNLYY